MEYKIDNQKYQVNIIKKSNKNTYIRVKEDLTIQVTTNYFVTKNYIKNLLDNNHEYLITAIEKRLKQEEKNKTFYYLGHSYDIIIMDAIKDVEIGNSRIYAKNEKVLNKWYKNEIIKIFDERLKHNYYLFNQNIKCPILKIRTMKTRWGIYNKKDHTITLNSNLIKYDIKYIDYVIIHELCHIIHFDHSKNFWLLVSKYVPNYKQLRKDLKE